jgi:hypothetical protein
VVKSRYAGNFTPAEAAELAEVMAAARLGALRVSHGLQLANPMELGFTTYDRLRAELVNFDAHARYELHRATALLSRRAMLAALNEHVRSLL